MNCSKQHAPKSTGERSRSQTLCCHRLPAAFTPSHTITLADEPVLPLPVHRRRWFIFILILKMVRHQSCIALPNMNASTHPCVCERYRTAQSCDCARCIALQVVNLIFLLGQAFEYNWVRAPHVLAHGSLSNHSESRRLCRGCGCRSASSLLDCSLTTSNLMS